MLAYTFDRYGPPDVLELVEVADPQPAVGEVLIDVRAASVNPRDWHILRGIPYAMRLSFGVRAPKVRRLGTDVAGVVVAVGPGVERIQVGDAVLADVPSGAFAERVVAAGELVAHLPASVSFEQGAAIPLAAVTALQGLRDRAGVRPGQRVLIVGASGGVGTFAVQLAVQLGAEVTGVCSGRNVDLVRSLGAAHVVDHIQDDPFAGDRTYDVIFQLAGTASPLACRRALTADGTLLVSSGEARGRWLGPIVRIGKAVAMSPVVPQRLRSFEATRSGTDLQDLANQVGEGDLTVVVDRTYPLRRLPEAIAYVETVRARGKVVIAVG